MRTTSDGSSRSSSTGRADAALLDSYEEERIPVARRLLHTTDRAFRLVVSDSRVAGLLRTQILARIAAFAMELRANTDSRVSRRLPDRHSLPAKLAVEITGAGCPMQRPHAGDRFPWLRLKFTTNGAIEDLFEKLDDTRFDADRDRAACAVPKDCDAPRRPACASTSIPTDPINDAELARARIAAPSFYLLRPDGHVGLCGARVDADAIARYMFEILRVGHGSA